MKSSFSWVAKVWIPIAVMILVPLILLNISTAVLMNAIYQNSRNRHLADIQQANALLENIVNDATKTVQLMAENGKIAALALLADPQSISAYQQYFHTSEVKKQLQFLDSFGCVTSFYFADTDIFFSASGVCAQGDDFYGTLYQYGSLTKEELENFTLHSREGRCLLPYGKYLVDGKLYEGIAYLSRFSSLYHTAAVTIITESQLERILGNVVRENGNSALFDQNGTLLYSYREEELPPLQDYRLSSEVTEYSIGNRTLMSQFSILTGINLVSYNVQAELYQESQRMNRNLWMLNIFCLFSALFISFFLVRGQILQMQDTLQLLSIPPKPKGRKNNLFRQIDLAVGALLHDKMETDQQVHQQIRVIMEHFWLDLLNGFLQDPEQIVYRAQNTAIPIEFSGFSIISILFRQKYDPEQENDLSLEYCNALYQKMCQDPVFGSMVCKWNHSQIVIVCGMNSQEIEAYRETICERIASYSASLPEETIFIAAGKPFRSLSQASERYAELQNILINFHEKESQTLIWEEDIAEQESPLFSISAELQTRLTSGILTGNFTVVKECLCTIVDKNFSNQYFSLVSCDLLKSHLKIIISKVYQEDMDFSLEDVLKQLDTQTNTQIVRFFLQLSEEMCRYYQQHIPSETNLKQQVIEYLEKFYSDPSLTLSSMAKHFGFSESYFSKLFKNMLNENFSTCLEKIRMEHADQMILHTQLRIEEIAQRVSYYNVSSFRRAYKRYTGVSPTERRESNSLKHS